MKFLNILPSFIRKKAELSPEFVKIIDNIGWMLFDKFIRIGLGIFVNVWVARYLGPNKFGLLNYAIACVTLFGAIATLGLDGIVVRELLKDENKNNILLGTAFVLKLIGSFVLLGIIIIFIYFTDLNLSNSITLLIATSTIFQSIFVVDFYFQSKFLNKYSVFSQIISVVIINIIKILLILTKAPLYYFASCYVLEACIISIGLIKFYQKNGMTISAWKFKINTAIDLLKNSWPIMLSTFMISIFLNIDQIMIMNMLNSNYAGQYAAAIKINSIITILPSIIIISITPLIIKSKNNSTERYNKIIQCLYNILSIYGIITSIFITIFGSYIIKMIYGSAFEITSNIFKIYTWSNIFSFLGAASSRWLINEGYEIKIFKRNILGAIINIVFNIILINKVGITGAAWATLISQISANLLYDYFDKETRCMFLQKINSLIIIIRYNKWQITI